MTETDANTSGESADASPPPSIVPRRFSLMQLMGLVALVGAFCFLAMACPLYGPYQIAATIAVLVGWLLVRGTKPPTIDDRSGAVTESGSKLGLLGAMLIWVGIVMSLYCLPACFVEATRPPDRLKDYDLYLDEQSKFPSNR